MQHFHKILTIALILFTTIQQAKGQFQKGMRMLGNSFVTGSFNNGSADISYPSNTNLNFSNKTSNINLGITPSLGWFLNERTVAGATMNIQFVNNTNSDLSGNGNTFRKTETGSFSLGAGGFVRSYFSTEGTWLFFGQGSLNLGFSNQDNKGFYFLDQPLTKVDFDGKSTAGFYTNAALTAGFTKLIGKNIGLDVFAGYVFNVNKYNYTNNFNYDTGNNGSVDATAKAETTTRYTGHSFTTGIGIQIFLDSRQ